MIIAAIASICAAPITLWGAPFNRRKIEEFSARPKQIDIAQQSQETVLNGEVNRLNFIAKSNHSKRAAVLADAYSKPAEIKLMVERFVAPLLFHPITGNTQTLTNAANKLKNPIGFAIYLKSDTNESQMNALAKIMANIKKIPNLANSAARTISARRQQAGTIIN